MLRLLAAGQANPEIAARLYAAVSTVKTYVNALFGKLGATSRTKAVARARALGLLADWRAGALRCNHRAATAQKRHRYDDLSVAPPPPCRPAPSPATSPGCPLPCALRAMPSPRVDGGCYAHPGPVISTP